MKKVSRSLIAAIAAVLLALALAACGGSDETVNYDGTYRLSAPEDGYYKFMVISGDEMDMYYGTSDDFSAATKLKNATLRSRGATATASPSPVTRCRS